VEAEGLYELNSLDGATLPRERLCVGHGLWIWEEDECLALRAVLAKHNADRPIAERITQRRIATELGVTPATINAYFGGRRALGIEVALAVLKLTGIPVEQFSQRLADEIRYKACL
jgi:DNA-binding XRE family transcriptional regulator